MANYRKRLENKFERVTTVNYSPLPGTEFSLLSEDDLYLFNEGTHARLYQKLGAHPAVFQSLTGTYFAVWAPNAERVTVIGDFNGWDKTINPLHPCGQSGIWGGFIPGVGKGASYKYHILSRIAGYCVDKADPIAFFSEQPPKTASVTDRLLPPMLQELDL